MKICAIRIRCVPQTRENSTTEIIKIIVSYTHVGEIVSLLVISSFSHWHFLIAAAVSTMWRHEQKWWPWRAPRLSVQTLDERDMRINMSNTVLGMYRSTPATQWWAHVDQHQQHSDGHSTSNTVMGTCRSAPATQWWAHADQHHSTSNTVMSTCKSAPATQWWAHADQHQQHSDGHTQISISNTVFGTSRSTSATKYHQQQLTKELDCAGPFKILLKPWHSDTWFSAPHIGLSLWLFSVCGSVPNVFATSKHKKGSKERYLLGQDKTSKFSG